MQTQILGLNMAGQPFAWLTTEEAIYYAAIGKVSWELGDNEFVFRGGHSRAGVRSEIRVKSIIAISGSEIMARYARQVLPLGDKNHLLFKRDRYLCCYCGMKFSAGQLTREHIVPTSRGGKNIWTNVASACRRCNEAKSARLLSECPKSLQLLYVPYAPCRNEHFILSARGAGPLADQMDFLSANLPAHSRCMNG